MSSINTPNRYGAGASGTSHALGRSNMTHTPTRRDVMSSATTPMNHLNAYETPSASHGTLPPAVPNGNQVKERAAYEARINVLEKDLDSKRQKIKKLEQEIASLPKDLANEEENRRNKLISQSKKDLDFERDRCRKLQAEFSAEHIWRKDVESRSLRLEGEARRIPILNDRIHELEVIISTMNTAQEEINHNYKRNIENSSLKTKPLQSVENLQNVSHIKIMEGKLSAFEKILEEKARESEKLKNYGLMADGRVEDLKETLTTVNKKHAETERELGQKEVIIADLRREISILESKVASYEEEINVRMVARRAETEDETNLTLAKYEKQISDLKAEIRNQTKLFTNSEAEKEQVKTKLRNIKREVQNHIQEIKSSERKKESLREENSMLQQRIEEAESNLTKENVVTNHLQEQVQRLTGRIENLDSFKVENDNSRCALEKQVFQLEADLRRKASVEEKMRVLQASYDRQSEDVNAEVKRHEETKQRILELDDKLIRSNKINGRVKDLENEIQTLMQDLEKARGQTCRGEFLNEELRREFDSEVRARKMLESKLEKLEEFKGELENRIQELETVEHMVGVLEGKIGELEKSLEEKGKDYIRVTLEKADEEKVVGDLQGQLLELDLLRDNITLLNQEKYTLVYNAEEEEDKRHELEKDVEAHKSKIRYLEVEVNRLNEEKLESEQLMTEIQNLTATNKIVQERIEEIEPQLSECNITIARLQSEVTGLTLNVSELKNLLSNERKNAEEIENQLRFDLEAVTMENGKLSAEFEQTMKDKIRITAESDWKQEKVDLSKAQCARLQEDLNEKIDYIEKLDSREVKRVEMVDTLSKRLESLRCEFEQGKEDLELAYDKNRVYEERIVELEISQKKVATMEGQIIGLESLLNTKEKDMIQSERNYNESRLKIKELETELLTTKKLEERIRELRSQIQNQSKTIDDLEKSTAEKNYSLMLKEKEIQFERERGMVIQEELSAESQVVEDLKAKIAMLDGELERQSELLGKISGLEVVIVANTAELEAERLRTAELLPKVRSLEVELLERDQLESTVNELKEQLERKNETIECLEGEETRRRDVVTRLQAEVTFLEEAKQAIELELEEIRFEANQRDVSDSKIRAGLEEQVKEIEKEHRGAVIDSNKLQVICQDLHVRLEQETASSIRTAERLKNTESVLSNAQKHLAFMEREAGTRTVGMENLERSLEAERASVAHLSYVLIQEMEQKNKIDVEVKEQERQLNYSERRAQSEISIRDSQIARLKKENEELTERLRDHSNLLSNKSEQIANDLHMRTTLQIELQNASDEREMLKAQLNATSEALVDARSANQTVTHQQSLAQEALEAKIRLLDLAEKRILSQEKRLAEEEMHVNELSRETAVREREVEIAVEELNDTRRILRSQIEDLKLRSNRFEEERDSARMEIKELQLKVQEVNIEKRNKVTEYENTLRVIDENRYAQSDYSGKLKDQSLFLEELKSENLRLREHIKKMSVDLDNTKSTTLQLQQQLSYMKVSPIF